MWEGVKYESLEFRQNINQLFPFDTLNMSNSMNKSYSFLTFSHILKIFLHDRHVFQKKIDLIKI